MCREILSIILAHNVVTSYESFQRTTEDLALFCNMYASIPDGIQQEIISEVGDVFYMFYHIVLIDMLDFNNSTWRLFRTRTLSHGLSIVELMVNIEEKRVI